LVDARVPELDPDRCIASGSLLYAASARPGRTEMLDIILLAIGFGFFALSVGYAMACDQL
jgi:hypothetical protein